MASLFDGGPAMRAVCQFRPWLEMRECLCEHGRGRKCGKLNENSMELEFCCSVIGVFFSATLKSKSHMEWR